LGGNPNKGFKPWLKKELEKRGFIVESPPMPNTNDPKLSGWVGHLSRMVGKPDKDCYFIGHSLGCITILKYLESLKENEMVGGAVLVAGFSVDLGDKYKVIARFTEKPVNWNMVMSHCKKFVAIHSDNDPAVPMIHGKMMEEKLGAKLIIEHNMEHFSSAPKLQSALDAVLEMAGK